MYTPKTDDFASHLESPWSMLVPVRDISAAKDVLLVARQTCVKIFDLHV